jgi:hypothetical protein
VEPFVFMAVSYDEGHVQGFQGQCARSAKEKACLAAARLSMREHDRSEGDDIYCETVSARLVMKSSRHLRA